jgi:hypothetical protein
MISSALYRFFGMVQISSRGFLPLLIWTRNFRLGQHRTDKEEFYQLLTYRDDVDLEKKLAAWEGFYNYDRPHGAHSGKTPYEVLREKLR